jgi:hypothetical protein
VPVDAPRTRPLGLACAVAVVVSGAYALGAAATTPFTSPANVMTAIPIVLVVILAVVRWPAHPGRSAGLLEEGRPRSGHPYLLWVVLLAAVAGWELVEYLWRGSRSAHPTLSSMADAFDGHAVGKTVAFLAWTWLGAAIVRAGTPSARRFRGSGSRSR